MHPLEMMEYTSDGVPLAEGWSLSCCFTKCECKFKWRVWGELGVGHRVGVRSVVGMNRGDNWFGKLSY